MTEILRDQAWVERERAAARAMLERHRTAEHPYSPLTGLMAPTHFGRPDFPKILSRHYEEMQGLFARDRKRKRKVGVFFCG